MGDFVGKGGLLLSMVGAEDAGPSRELLADFGLGVPPMPLPPAENTRETVPLGATAQVFASDGDRAAWVQFHAAWPIQRPRMRRCSAPRPMASTSTRSWWAARSAPAPWC